MYRLLLVSDQDEVLQAFDQVHNWEFNGFRRPHVRQDLDGAKEALSSHHCDAISIAVDGEEAERLLAWLDAEHPMLPIMEAGRTPEEVQEYLAELNQTLNRLRADFTSDSYDEQVMFIRARRHFFRKLVGGENITTRQLYRTMRLLRSRMDPDRHCVLMNLEQTSVEDDRLVGRWQDSDHLLERTMFQSFGGDVKGFHVLPLITEDGRAYVLSVPLRAEKGQDFGEDVAAMLTSVVQDGIQHAEEYQGLHLRMTGIQVYPCMYALCSDYAA